MATSLKTPGFYVREFAQKAVVEQAETAIPAFAGYTEKADDAGTNLKNVPFLIRSLTEFEYHFGGAPAATRDVVMNADKSIKSVSARYYLHASMVAYFANGGGECYIVSVGDYDTTPALADLFDDTAGSEKGLATVASLDEVTLLAAPDAILLTDAQRGTLHESLLAQCANHQFQFALLDLPDSDDFDNAVTTFRTEVGSKYLKYGAAYAPHLITSQPISLGYSDLRETTIDPSIHATNAIDFSTYWGTDAAIAEMEVLANDADIIETRLYTAFSGTSYIDHFDGFNALDELEVESKFEIFESLMQELHYYAFSPTANRFLSDPEIVAELKEDLKIGGKAYHLVRKAFSYQASWPGTSFAPAPFASTDFTASHPFTTDANYNYALATAGSVDVWGTGSTDADYVATGRPFMREVFIEALTLHLELLEKVKAKLAAIEEALETSNPNYSAFIGQVRQLGITIPPSAVAAAAMARTDRERGVWVAPANFDLIDVVGPVKTISHYEQEDLNVDPNGGKSINAIRALNGRGTRIYGARTLAGNDLEWRYINVRRFYQMVEKSVKEALEPFVFEPNNGKTWVRAKSAIQNFLNKLWRQGALNGTVPSEAYFVKVGLGESMSAQDVLEGQLIVEIGMAAVRPAEFITMRLAYSIDS